MKKLLCLFLLAVSVVLAGCSGGAANMEKMAELNEKASAGDVAKMTQDDFSDMIDYLSTALDDMPKYKDSKDFEEKYPYANRFMGALTVAQMRDSLDAKNQEKFEKLCKKLEEMMMKQLQAAN